jgi:hypothetical protein
VDLKNKSEDTDIITVSVGNQLIFFFAGVQLAKLYYERCWLRHDLDINLVYKFNYSFQHVNEDNKCFQYTVYG